MRNSVIEIIWSTLLHLHRGPKTPPGGRALPKITHVLRGRPATGAQGHHVETVHVTPGVQEKLNTLPFLPLASAPL